MKESGSERKRKEREVFVERKNKERRVMNNVKR